MMFPDFFYVDWLIFIEFKRVFFFILGFLLLSLDKFYFEKTRRTKPQIKHNLLAQKVSVWLVVPVDRPVLRCCPDKQT